jgi:hypothetical protein
MCAVMVERHDFFTVEREFFHDTMLQYPLGVGLTEFQPLEIARDVLIWTS